MGHREGGGGNGCLPRVLPRTSLDGRAPSGTQLQPQDASSLGGKEETEPKVDTES